MNLSSPNFLSYCSKQLHCVVEKRRSKRLQNVRRTKFAFKNFKRKCGGATHFCFFFFHAAVCWIFEDEWVFEVRKSKRWKLFAFSDTYRLQFNSTFPAGSQGFLLCSRTSPACPPLWKTTPMSRKNEKNRAQPTKIGEKSPEPLKFRSSELSKCRSFGAVEIPLKLRSRWTFGAVKLPHALTFRSRLNFGAPKFRNVRAKKRKCRSFGAAEFSELQNFGAVEISACFDFPEPLKFRSSEISKCRSFGAVEISEAWNFGALRWPLLWKGVLGGETGTGPHKML